MDWKDRVNKEDLERGNDRASREDMLYRVGRDG